MPKLTLSADQETIDRAKRLAAEQGTSVSEMFRAFVLSLNGETLSDEPEVGPITRKLTGICKIDDDRPYKELIREAIEHRYLK